MSRFPPTEPLALSRRGLASVEFALVAPFILMLMLAGADLTIFMRTKLRIDETATQVALDVTQYNNLYDSDFTGLYNAAQTVAGTTPVTGVLGTTIITGMINSSGKQTIAWQRRSASATFNSLFGAAGATPVLPASYVLPSGGVLIGVEVFTTASPWVLSAGLMGASPTSSLRAYVLFQPRLGSLATVNSGTRP
jgi:Flp pilus assembly protein TadG